MGYYYVALITRSHAFLLERRLKAQGVLCELSYMPREIMIDVCNMGIRFFESQLAAALIVIRRSGLPGCKLYKEILYPDGCMYEEVQM